MVRHMCDVAGCGQLFDTMAEVIEHERSCRHGDSTCAKRSFVHARPMPHLWRDGACEFCTATERDARFAPVEQSGGGNQ